MLNSRLTAFITVILLITIISLATIGIVQGIGTAITHGPGIEQDSGTIVSINPDHSFMLKTTDGTLEHFQCKERCARGESHMYRHLHERAHTDVYYRRTTNGILIATDVD